MPPTARSTQRSHVGSPRSASATKGEGKTVMMASSRPAIFADPPPPKGRRQQLVTIHEVPEWLRFNPYILTGYRTTTTRGGGGNTTMTISEAIQSLFTLHNESINVWSHFFPALLLSYFLLNTPTPYLDGWLAKLVTLGSIVILYASSAYHLFMPCCGSRSSYVKLLSCDVLSALFSCTTSAYSFILLGSKCSPWLGSGGGGGYHQQQQADSTTAVAMAVAAARDGGVFEPTTFLWFLVAIFTLHAFLVATSVKWSPGMSAVGRVALFGSLCTLRLIMCWVTGYEKYKYSGRSSGGAGVSGDGSFTFVHDASIVASATLFSRAFVSHSMSYFALLVGGVLNAMRIPERWMVVEEQNNTEVGVRENNKLKKEEDDGRSHSGGDDNEALYYHHHVTYVRPWWYLRWIDYSLNSHNLWHLLSLTSIILTQVGTGFDAQEWDAMRCVN